MTTFITKVSPETTSTGILLAFSWRLHDMLGEAEQNGFERTISWIYESRQNGYMFIASDNEDEIIQTFA